MEMYAIPGENRCRIVMQVIWSPLQENKCDSVFPIRKFHRSAGASDK